MPAKSDSIEKPELDPKDDKFSLVKAAGEYILKLGNHTDPDSTLSTKQVFDKAKKEFPEIFASFHEGTFGVYLSKAGNDTESRINTLGKKQGYYLTPNVAAQLLKEPDEEAEAEKVKQRERLLYPVIENWLMEQGYQASDVSTLKAGGAWGNPDLCGLDTMWK